MSVVKLRIKNFNPEKSGVLKYYVKILRHFRKLKTIEEASKYNPSFATFIDALRPIRAASDVTD